MRVKGAGVLQLMAASADSAWRRAFPEGEGDAARLALAGCRAVVLRADARQGAELTTLEVAGTHTGARAWFPMDCLAWLPAAALSPRRLGSPESGNVAAARVARVIANGRRSPQRIGQDAHAFSEGSPVRVRELEFLQRSIIFLYLYGNT